MCDPSLRWRIEEALEEIEELKRRYPPLPAGDWELALEVGEDETGELICSYYFVRPSTRCLFWLHEFDIKPAIAGLRGVTEHPHVRESTPPSSQLSTDHATRPCIGNPVLVNPSARS